MPAPAAAAAPLRTVCAALALLTAAAAAPAQMTHEHARALGPEALRRAYLACHRAAMEDRLSIGDAMDCSVIYETLKQREFGGDFERLAAWARTQLPPPRRAVN